MPLSASSSSSSAPMDGADPVGGARIAPVHMPQLPPAAATASSLSAQYDNAGAAMTNASLEPRKSVEGTANPVKNDGGANKPPALKCGYLFKQSSGKWKRKRWNQRWFVLDSDSGVLKYFRHASPPEIVHTRQDAHDAMQLTAKGVSLVIQGDLPRGVPTPFCFTVSSGTHRAFRICTDTNQEFKEWTNAISLVMSPREPAGESEDAGTNGSSSLMGDGRVDLPRLTTRDSSASSSSSGPPSPSRGEESTSDADCPLDAAANISKVHPFATSQHEQRPSGFFPANMRSRLAGNETTALLLFLNPVVVLIRFGSLQALYATAFFINAVCVWLLWLHNAPDEIAALPSSSVIGTLRLNQNQKAARYDSPASFQVISTLAGTSGKSSQPTAAKLSNGSGAAQPPFVSKFLGIVNGVKVSAGSSVKMCAPAPAEISPGCWTQISATRFNVRQGPNYRRTKQKAASIPALLELLAIDVYSSDGKIDNIASIVDISNLKTSEHPLDLFVVNCQVPNYQPSNPLWGEKQGDGTGFNFVTYFAIPPAVRKMLETDDPPLQAVKLLKTFMQGASGVRDRFKAIGIVVNPQEQKLGRTERHLLETYNGQPILTRPQHRFYEGEGYFEVDVDAHEFNFVARKGLVGVSEHFRNMVVDFGFVLEGQEDSELPEQILGSVRLCKIDVRQAPFIT